MKSIWHLYDIYIYIHIIRTHASLAAFNFGSFLLPNVLNGFFSFKQTNPRTTITNFHHRNPEDNGRKWEKEALGGANLFMRLVEALDEAPYGSWMDAEAVLELESMKEDGCLTVTDLFDFFFGRNNKLCVCVFFVGISTFFVGGGVVEEGGCFEEMGWEVG